MKKLIFLLLFIALGCVDQEIKPTVRENSDLKFKDASPMNIWECVSKWYLYSFGYNYWQYDEVAFMSPVSANVQESISGYNPSSYYELTLTIKNNSAFIVKLYKNGNFVTNIPSNGGTHNFVWTLGSCECRFNNCAKLNESFTWTVTSTKGNHLYIDHYYSVNSPHQVPTHSFAQIHFSRQP